MRIIGKTEEIEWLMESLANGCDHCPYGEECSQRTLVEIDQDENSKAPVSCKEFLRKKIIIEIE